MLQSSVLLFRLVVSEGFSAQAEQVVEGMSFPAAQMQRALPPSAFFPTQEPSL